MFNKENEVTEHHALSQLKHSAPITIILSNELLMDKLISKYGRLSIPLRYQLIFIIPF